jgi:hypothetical protein
MALGYYNRTNRQQKRKNHLEILLFNIDKRGKRRREEQIK